MGLESVISFIDTPKDIRAIYEYFTEANMKKLRKAGYKKSFYTLEEGVKGLSEKIFTQEANLVNKFSLFRF